MRAFILGLCAAAVLGCFPAAAEAFHFTNRLSVTAQLTDNWTVHDTDSCGPQGSGSLSLSLASVASTRFRPEVDSSAGRPLSKKLGAWVYLVPKGVASTEMGPRKSTGTLTTVDNTVPGPDTIDPTVPCPPFDKTGCGTKSLSGGSIDLTLFDKRHTVATASPPHGEFDADTSCRIGALQSWTSPQKIAGGLSARDTIVDSGMLFKMPSPRSMEHKRMTVLTETDHKSTTTPPVSGGTQTITDDVTRTITVTISRL